MRIISGIHKGRRLTAPKNLPVRPTTDMAKESLFNILNNHYYINDLSVIELFAGTGNISYEFASRGADPVSCVDIDLKCIRYIEATSKLLEFNFSVIKSDVFSYLEKVKTKADIIFADPPYDLPIEDFEKIAALVFKNDLLNNDGMLILEHSKYMDLSHLTAITETRRYGVSVFSFFKNEINEEE